MARIEVIRSGLDRWSLKKLAGFDVGCRDFIRTRTGDSGFGRSHERLAPEEGLEPSTHRLTADCSTIELLWNARRRRKLAVGISFRQRAFIADFAAWMAEKLKWGRDRLRGADQAGCGVRAPRDRACTRRKARGRFGFLRFARGEGLFAFNARSGSVPLPLGGLWGQATPP